MLIPFWSERPLRRPPCPEEPERRIGELIHRPALGNDVHPRADVRHHGCRPKDAETALAQRAKDSLGASAAAVDGEVPTSDMTLLFFPVSADARVAVFARQAIDHFLFFIAGVKTMALVPLVCGKRSPG